MKVFGVERSGKEKIAISSRTLMEVGTNLASYFQNRRPDAIPHSSTKYEELKLVKIEKSSHRPSLTLGDKSLTLLIYLLSSGNEGIDVLQYVGTNTDLKRSSCLGLGADGRENCVWIPQRKVPRSFKQRVRLPITRSWTLRHVLTVLQIQRSK